MGFIVAGQCLNKHQTGQQNGCNDAAAELRQSRKFGQEFGVVVGCLCGTWSAKGPETVSHFQRTVFEQMKMVLNGNILEEFETPF